MCRMRNIAKRDYQESVTTGQTHGQTDAGQSDPYVPLCFTGGTTKKLMIYCKQLKDMEIAKRDFRVRLSSHIAVTKTMSICWHQQKLCMTNFSTIGHLEDWGFAHIFLFHIHFVCVVLHRRNNILLSDQSELRSLADGTYTLQTFVEKVHFVFR